LEREFTHCRLVFSLLLTLSVPALLSAQDTLNPTSSKATAGLQLSTECLSADRAPADLVQAVIAQPNAPAYDQLGVAFGRDGDYRCAESAFEAALAIDPAAVQPRYDLALALIQVHQPQRAAQELRTVIEQQPDSFAAHNALGLALQDLHNPDAAKQEFKTAIAISPRFALAYYDLGQLLSSQGSYKVAAYYLEQGLTTSPVPQLSLQMKAALAVAHAQLGDYSAAIPLLQEVVAANQNAAELHYDLATAYAHRENYREAVKEYKEVLRLDPSRSDAQLLLAKALLNQSAIEAAIPYLQDYVHRNPNNSEGLEVLGDALKDSSHPTEAIAALNRAIEANPSSYKSHYDLGVVLGRSGSLDDAIHELQMAVKIKPDGSEARYQLARLLSRNKQNDAAKEQFTAFEELKQKEEQQTKAAFLGNQANDWLKQGRLKEAVEGYRKAVSLNPNDAKLHYNLAVALARVGDDSAQRFELQQAISLDSRFASAHNQLGSLLMSEGQFSDAEREFTTALDIDPQSAEALDNLGTSLGRQGRNEEAERLFQRAIDADPQSPLGYVNLGLTLASMGRYTDAERQFRTALQLQPGNAKALTALGMFQGKSGRNTEAVETFRKLVALDPTSADAHVNLGIALGDINNLDGALTELSEAARLAPNSAMAHYNRGRVLYALHRNEDARQALATAVKLSPDYIDALLLLGVIEHSSTYATQLFQRVVDLAPQNAQARFYLGRNLVQEGKKDEAIAQWKKAVEVDPDNLSALSSLTRVLTQMKSPESGEYAVRLQALQQKQQTTERVKELNNFALRSAEEQKWDQAVSQLQEAIGLCQQCVQLGVLRKNMGLIYARKGDSEHARQELQIALKLLPKGPDLIAAEQALQQLQRLPASVH
jgi:tetratricopeptide (TPR) repeat protein